jgi:hypothetical protein
VEELSGRVHKTKVVLDITAGDEQTLALVHQLGKSCCQAIGQDFGHHLANRLYEGYGFEILDAGHFRGLG